MNAVFAEPGLAPEDVQTLFEVLARLRGGAGDFHPDGEQDG